MDFTRDYRTGWLEQAQLLAVWPDAVKAASVPVDEDLNKLPDTAFADRLKREYPMGDSVQTAYSFAYGLINKQASTSVLSKLKHRGTAQGIGEFISNLEAAYSGSIKQASAKPVEYAMTVDLGPGDPDGADAQTKQGGVKGYYPISTQWQVEESARQLALDHTKMPVGWFRKAASRIVEAADKFNTVAIPDMVVKYGENRMVSPWAATIIPRQRANFVSPDVLDTYQKIAAVAELETDPDKMEELSEMVETLDRHYKISSAYRKTVTDPWQVLFGSWSTKEAKEVAESNIQLLDVLVPLDTWKNMPESAWRGQVSSEVATKIAAAQKVTSGLEASKMAATWPAGLQKQLLKALLATEQAA